ncbi:MAG: response regulator [Furfurilactobacillus sp.]|jgi:two-component system CitB family response regulator/CitB family two-component system response regulator MalR|uniref:Transcriptional regulatory protein n=1 Tax=Furfurilactobacillus milii TaxID=2888272 RepID=A0ABT6D6R7_9LACO|nr:MULTISPECIES: response regulator [Furfurilactobacillus]QLE66367.1 Two-component response regulator malate [Furfurilactobacillus rossiae]MCF6159823.1 response regulator [Furfurilactobacillus milii]MCF6162628.1 response regulator [Furfurilactobacillus milii]MCF6419201.1 response regulator [Furfurilactobacillus milii]MCH4010922.1 response regulator [Furfurilactobacillus sp.]
MMNVLIVEDDPMVSAINQQYLKKIIPSTQLSLTKIDNGMDALSILKQRPMDLMLLDVYMPKLSGSEVLTELMRLEIHPQVIMLTAANDTEHVKAAIDYGVLDYLIKPFTFDRFKQAVTKFLQMHQSLKNAGSLAQKDLDQLFTPTAPQSSQLQQALPKGLSRLSLERVTTAIQPLQAPFSVQDAAQAAKLSRISTKKYLDYLIETHQLSSSIKYLAVGRPLTVYEFIN